MISRHARLTIGLGIGRDAVRAVGLRRGRIVWALERARGDEPLVRTIGLVLGDAPCPRWPRPTVAAAVGPSHAQTKRLVGLPPLKDASRFGGVVRESVSRLFLKNGVPLVTTWRPASNGPPWGAALEEPVLQAIEEACRARRVRLDTIVPTVSVLGFVADNGSGTGVMRWNDGDQWVDLSFERGELDTVRRAGESEGLTCGDCTHSTILDALGPNGSRFADALGAARARSGAVLAWRGRRDPQPRATPVWRLALAATAAIVAALAWLAAPGVGARFTQRAAVASLAKLAPLRRDVAFAAREFEKVTRALNEVSAFDSLRYPMTPLLADLTRALPDESALVTLRLLRDAGNLVALTPRAAAMLTKLETVPGIEGAEIVGPVTREVLAGKTLERVTVRFQVRPAERRVGRSGA